MQFKHGSAYVQQLCVERITLLGFNDFPQGKG